jgi:hypothetical protein
MALVGVTLLITYLRSAATPDRDAAQTRSSARRLGPHRPAANQVSRLEAPRSPT